MDKKLRGGTARTERHSPTDQSDIQDHMALYKAKARRRTRWEGNVGIFSSQTTIPHGEALLF